MIPPLVALPMDTKYCAVRVMLLYVMSYTPTFVKRHLP